MHRRRITFERFLDGGKGWSEDNIAACFSLAACYTALGEPEKGAVRPAQKLFCTTARAAKSAANSAITISGARTTGTPLPGFGPPPSSTLPTQWAFVLPDYWGYIPNIECCVCCCYLSRFDEAAQFNARAGACKPNSPAVRQNEQYLASLRE